MRYLKRTIYWPCLCLLIVLLSAVDSGARSRYETKDIEEKLNGKAGECYENVDYAVHDINLMGFTVANMGIWGLGFLGNLGVSLPGDIPSCAYPYPGQNNYLFSASIWFGAIVGQDTLVSVGADGWSYNLEMWPAPSPDGDIIARSILNPQDLDAVSEQDYIVKFVDTVTDPTCVSEDAFDCRPHLPLGIEVTQRSFAWSYSYAQDFIIFDYTIKNIGSQMLEDVHMGVYVDGDVGTWDYWDDAQDDISGFRRSVPSYVTCPGEDWLDTINIAWISDNDGKRNVGDLPPCPDAMTLPAVTGLRVLATPSESAEISYNWWLSNSDPSRDWGPRLTGTPEDPFRDFGTGGLGTPMGDRNKYYMMRHDEFDYDQLYCGIDHSAEGWLPPPFIGPQLADGFDTRYLLSCGPFNINPGEELPLTLAYVAGDNFHTDCDAFENLFDVNNPDQFYNYLNFSDLGTNSIWASWIYDNPGVDTDDNGYRGPFRVCVYDSVLNHCDTTILPPADTIIDCYWDYTVADTVYTAGDGVPDFRGAMPPPGPDVRLEPIQNGIRVRWNGLHSETTYDMFTRLIDFEGYRVYITIDSGTPGTYTQIASYDREDFYRYVWNGVFWQIITPPFTADELLALYGITDPLNYTSDNPFIYGDSVFYFTMVDWNNSDLTDSSKIFKRFPDEPYPVTLNIDSAQDCCPQILVYEGDTVYFKYFEYEYNIQNLFSDGPYCVSVTAFDYGSYTSELSQLESSVTHKTKCAIPISGFEISGSVIYYDMVMGIPDVLVSMSDPIIETNSDTYGHYVFEDLQPGSFTITPSKESDDIGVSVADCVKIRRHLATLETFDSPYKLIAGDVNCSGGVSVADIIKIRRYIAQLEDLPCGNWTFIDSSFAIDSSNWSIAPRSFIATLTDQDVNDCSFIGVRLGDVNDTWSPVKVAKPSEASAKSISIKNTYTIPGVEITVPVLIEANTEIAGLEMHLKYDPEILDFTKITTELPGELTINEIDDAIHIIWEDIYNVLSTAGDEPTVLVQFALKNDFDSETEIEIVDAEIVDTKGEPYMLILKNGKVFSGNPSGVLPEEYGLEQNVPNPFNPVTEIRFSLPEASQVNLEIFNVMGQRVNTLVNERMESGRHSFMWNASSFASGIYFMRLRAGKFVDTKKMILLK